MLSVIKSHIMQGGSEMKFKDFSWKGNRLRYLLIIGSVIMLIGLRAMAVPLIFVFYLILSLVGKGKGDA